MFCLTGTRKIQEKNVDARSRSEQIARPECLDDEQTGDAHQAAHPSASVGNHGGSRPSISIRMVEMNIGRPSYVRED